MNRSFEFFFDLMSPYSYLASTQVDALAERTGTTVRWRPFYLPGVMKATGNGGPTAVQAKAVYAVKDLGDWTRHYGLPELKFPPNFPFIATQGMRLALLADEAGKCGAFSREVFRRTWANGEDCTQPQLLTEALQTAGLSGELLQRAGSDEVKAKLKANTDEAIARGAFGAPTFFVGDEMFVGNDRLPFVEKALRV